MASLGGAASRGARFACLFAMQIGLFASVAGASQTDSVLASRFAQLALDCIHREYPNKIAHVLNGDEDVRPPRELTPAFYGCFDWHSSVHGHWLLARVARFYPDTDSAGPALGRARQEPDASQYRRRSPIRSSARPLGLRAAYGAAWLLQLAAELREWDDPDARRWLAALEPLETVAALQIKEWLPKLTHPIRVGEHSQTAFAFGLILDWAHVAGDTDMVDLLDARIADYYTRDRDCPLRYEPSGHDFLSPCVAEADLMRRVTEGEVFADWLRELLPGIPEDGDPSGWLEPAMVSDPGDGKLVHLDGLNLSRAWMLEGIADALPEEDPRRAALRAAGRQHREAGLDAVAGEHYEGGHWLGSFATYLVTQRGLRGPAP